MAARGPAAARRTAGIFRRTGVLGLGICGQYFGDDFTQEFSQPLEDGVEVVADDDHDGVDLISLSQHLR